jgi:hypothetical protein
MSGEASREALADRYCLIGRGPHCAGDPAGAFVDCEGLRRGRLGRAWASHRRRTPPNAWARAGSGGAGSGRLGWSASPPSHGRHRRRQWIGLDRHRWGTKHEGGEGCRRWLEMSDPAKQGVELAMVALDLAARGARRGWGRSGPAATIIAASWLVGRRATPAAASRRQAVGRLGAVRPGAGSVRHLSTHSHHTHAHP